MKFTREEYEKLKALRKEKGGYDKVVKIVCDEGAIYGYGVKELIFKDDTCEIKYTTYDTCD